MTNDRGAGMPPAYGGVGAGSSSQPARHGTSGVIMVESAHGQVFFTKGNGEYIVPDGVDSIEVTMCGGGGGASEEEPGGDAQWVRETYNVRPGDRFAYHVGEGGAPGINGEPGQDGCATSFERML